jgi:hypothetical protein
MLNRPTVRREPLDARHAISREMRERLREIPPSPLDWEGFDPQSVLLENDCSPALATLASLLCAAPARATELRALWRESMATAVFALKLAPLLGADAGSSAIAGLLHRLGDMLTIRAIGVFEQAEHQRIDATSKAELCATYGVDLLERVLRDWRVPPRAAATAAGWRRLREFPGAAAEATTVYLARLLAIEAISPEFCAPGLIELAAEEAGLDYQELRSTTENAARRRRP